MPRQRVRRKGEREAADAAGSTSWKSCRRDKGGKRAGDQRIWGDKLIDERSLKEEFNGVIALESRDARPHFTVITIQCDLM
ncbi:DSC E3 ubiquitin ligase complex subunit 4 [Fusarium oxysporum f. sp. albedinis]|jgi:hypothetical protein|nr:DSC E3 ubiquitin ligase complex subunit 4 [Fusarium oxysporum f. sp. albedinis]